MKAVVGVGFVMAFNILQAVSAVFLASFLHRADTLVVLFFVFTVIAATFITVGVIRGGKIRVPQSAWPALALLNITTAASWSSFFLAVKYIEPAISSVFINAILPLATLGTEYLITGPRTAKKSDLFTSCALCVAMFLTATALFGGQSGRPASETGSYLIGFVMSAICGVAMSVTNVASKKLNNEGVRADQIMAHRFTLLILIAFLFMDKGRLVDQVAAQWGALLFVAIIGNLVPIYCLQLGIQKLKPITIAFLIGLAPMIFFAVQGFSNVVSFSYISLACVTLTTVILLMGTYLSIETTPASVRS
jgi:drug/metabolite transporter (DMT)-like permease